MNLTVTLNERNVLNFFKNNQIYLKFARFFHSISKKLRSKKPNRVKFTTKKQVRQNTELNIAITKVIREMRLWRLENKKLFL